MFPSRWRTSGYHRRSLLKGIGSQRPSCGRKAHCESRSPTREVAGDQLAAHRRDQVHRDRQPESGSLSRGLGGEKGLEQTLQNFRGNARSVVLHVDDNLLILASPRSEEHTSELQSRQYLVCRLLLEKKKQTTYSQACPYRLCSLVRERIKSQITESVSA